MLHHSGRGLEPPALLEKRADHGLVIFTLKVEEVGFGGADVKRVKPDLRPLVPSTRAVPLLHVLPWAPRMTMPFTTCLIGTQWCDRP
jgi:hypothetical protein